LLIIRLKADLASLDFLDGSGVGAGEGNKKDDINLDQGDLFANERELARSGANYAVNAYK
jgi:hypothetical protein